MTPIPLRIEPLELRIAPAGVASINVSSLNGTNGLRVDGTGTQHYAGTSVSGAGDINGDGFDDFIFGESLPEAGSRLGRAFVVFGKASGFPAALDPLTLNGSDGFEISEAISMTPAHGPGVARAGDVNDDGFDDLLVSGGGTAFVIFGKASGFAPKISVTALNGSNGFGFSDQSGSAEETAGAAGDVNGDGIDDLIYTARSDAYVLFGQATSFAPFVDLSTLNGNDGFRVDVPGDFAIHPDVSGVGDMNGDGFDDVVVGSLTDNSNGDSAGAVFVVFGHAGPFAASIGTASLDGTNGFRFQGDGQTPMGYAVAGAGDINADGFGDLITSTAVLFGRATFPASFAATSLDGTQGFRFASFGRFDRGVASAGDFNHDGFDDILFGQPQDPSVALVYGKAEPFAAEEDFFGLDGTDGLTIILPAGGRAARGYPLEAAGDVNGDGVDDVIIGAPDADTRGTNSGAAYVVFGLAPSLSVSDASLAEGLNGTASATLTVSLSGTLDSAVSVFVSTADGSAIAGEDYDALGLTELTFAAGETAKTVQVTVRGDAKFEANETFTLTLSNATGATISDAQGLGTITNDDTRPVITISDASLPEPAAGDALATLTVSLSNPSSETVTVTAGTADGTAVSPADYTALAATVLTFTPGEITKPISVPVHADAIAEGDETFSVVLSGETNSTIGKAAGQVTILNVQPPPAISIADVEVMEGDSANVPAVFTIALSSPSSGAVTVRYALADGTALAFADYLPLDPGQLVFQPGETTKTIAVQTLGNTGDDEDARTFFLQLSEPIGATLADISATAVILDNDASPGFSISDAVATEGNNATTFATFTVSLSAASRRATSVRYATAEGTATEGSDFTAFPGGVLEFAPGQTSISISVPIIGDLLNEADEAFLVQLSDGVNASVDDTVGSGVILDNDPLPTLSVSDLRIAEGPTGSANIAFFTVSLSAVSGREVALGFATQDGTALAGSDYLATSGMVLIPAGQNQGTISVSLLGDLTVEQAEQFFVLLSTPTGATISDGIGLGTIANDDVQIVNPHTATFTDVDGDLVTVRLTRGTLAADDFTLALGNGSIGMRLASLKVAAKPGAELVIRAQPQPGIGGDGQVNVGRIDAFGVDFGRVKIRGDLSEIDAGDSNERSPAIGKLDVRSMGVFDQASAPTPGSGFVGGVTELRVRGDLNGVALIASGPNGGFGHVDIEGSARSSGHGGAGLFATGNIGLLEIGGDLLGTGQAPFTISARGAAAPGGAIAAAIAAVTITGKAEFASILAGYMPDGSADNANVQIGSVSVGGDWRASSLAVGVDAGDDGFFGNADDRLITGGNGAVARIARITIKGSVFGTDLADDHFGFVAEELGKLKIAGELVPLTSGPRNDVEGIALGANGDLRARELAS